MVRSNQKLLALDEDVVLVNFLRDGVVHEDGHAPDLPFRLEQFPLLVSFQHFLLDFSISVFAEVEGFEL